MAVSEDTLLLPKSRQALEDLIEAAIARLDELDGDPDLEETCEDDGVDTDSEFDYRNESICTVHHYDCSPIRFGRQP